MNEKTVELMKFLDVCEEIEAIASQIYYFFAVHLAGHEKISLLMHKNAGDEENHALQVVKARKRVEAIAGLRFDLNQAELTRNQLFTTIDGFKKAPPSLEEALRMSIMIEKLLAQFHKSNLFIFKNKEGEPLFEPLVKHGSNHIANLEIALTELLLVRRLQAAWG